MNRVSRVSRVRTVRRRLGLIHPVDNFMQTTVLFCRKNRSLVFATFKCTSCFLLPASVLYYSYPCFLVVARFKFQHEIRVAAAMDPVSVIASIIAILQATASVVQYINDVKDSRQERISLRNEISSASWPLHMLHDRIVQEQKRLDADDDGADESWLSSVLILGTAGGPLEQFKIVLDELERKIAPPGRKGKGKTMQTLGKMLTWPFQKDDIERYLRMIERQKSTFYLALQNDNL